MQSCLLPKGSRSNIYPYTKKTLRTAAYLSWGPMMWISPQPGQTTGVGDLPGIHRPGASAGLSPVGALFFWATAL